MRMECGWCGGYIGEKKPLDDPLTIHGVCSECLNSMAEEIRRAKEAEIPPSGIAESAGEMRMMLTKHEQITQLLEAEPYKYLQEDIARKFSVTKQYVSIIMHEEGLLHLLKKKGYYCPGCGKSVFSSSHLCRDCSKKLRRVTLTCDYCGKEFIRKKSEAKKSKLHFCDSHCKGRFAGRHYGFVAHPENARLIKEQRQVEYRRMPMSELDKELKITEISKAELPTRMGFGRYAELLRRCSELPDDKALRIKCSTKGVAQNTRSYLKVRSKVIGLDIIATTRTEPGGFYVYLAEVRKLMEG